MAFGERLNQASCHGAIRSWVASGLLVATTMTGALAGMLLPGAAVAQTCGTLPATYPITAGSSGSLTVGSGSTVNGSTISGSGNSVQMSGVRTSTTPTFPVLSPSSYPSFTSSNPTTAATVAAGTYSSVTPAGSTTTTFSGGTYYITSLSATAASSTLVFNSGTYYITTASLTGGSLTVTISGTVILNIGSGFSTGTSSNFNNGGTAANLQIFLYPGASVSLGTSSNLTGVIYGPGTGNSVALASGAHVTGVVAVTGAITLAGSDSVTLSASNQTAIGNVSTCPVASNINHYYVEPLTLSAVNCAPAVFFIYPHDSSHNPQSTSDTMLLSTSTGHGDWQIFGQGTFIPGTPNSGTATYEWSSSGDSDILLAFLYDTYPETVTVNVSDGAITATSGTAGDGHDSNSDSPITFQATGFRISNGNNAPAYIGTQQAGVASTQTLYLQAVQTNTQTGACTGIFGSGTTVSVPMAFQCNNPTSCVAGQTLSITNNGTTTNIASNPNSGISNYTSVPLKFTTSNGEAPITLNYSDVGQITLAEKYNLPLNNQSPSVNNLVGSSQFVVQPYTLQLSNIKATASGAANPAATSATGPVFLGAGQPFSATVTAVNYAGNATPNFGQETTPASVALSQALVLPASGDNPTVSGGFGTFSGGAATGTAFTWPEVGIITLTPQVSNYLSSGAVAGTISANIGRFVPNSFTTTTNAPSFAPACGTGNFTYVGQPFNYSVAPVITATAVALGGTTTQNYTGAFMRMTNASLTGRTYTPTPSSPALNLTGLLPTTGDPAIGDNGNGTVTLTFSSGTGLSFTRGSAIAPFNANIELSENVIDLDAVTATTNPVTFGATSGIAFTGSNGSQQRYGRLALRDAVGSELLDLPMQLTTQYYSGTTQGFITNPADSCSVAPTIAFSSPQPNLTTNQMCVRDKGSPGYSGVGCSTPAATLTSYTEYTGDAVGGDFNLILATPGNTGAVTVTATGPSWLEYPTPLSGGSNAQPYGIASFGLFPGSKTRIYQREAY